MNEQQLKPVLKVTINPFKPVTSLLRLSRIHAINVNVTFLENARHRCIVIYNLCRMRSFSCLRTAVNIVLWTITKHEKCFFNFNLKSKQKWHFLVNNRIEVEKIRNIKKVLIEYIMFIYYWFRHVAKYALAQGYNVMIYEQEDFDRVVHEQNRQRSMWCQSCVNLRQCIKDYSIL